MQTVLTNKDYRVRVDTQAIANESEKQEFSIKDLLSIYIQNLKPDTIDHLTTKYISLWDHFKSKYVYVTKIEDTTVFLNYLSNRLHQLLDDLHSQVLNEDFDHIENYLNSAKDQSTNLNDYKYEKIKFKKEHEGNNTHSTSQKDLIRSKVEYLRNFRDIFGEFEYILEIIDCIGSNLQEKMAVVKPQAAGGQKTQSVDGQMMEIEDNYQVRPLDNTTKKLMEHYLGSDISGKTNIQKCCMEYVKKICSTLSYYLAIFMKDSVFSDYFQSTWMINMNFLEVLAEKKYELYKEITIKLVEYFIQLNSIQSPSQHSLQTFNLIIENFKSNSILLTDCDVIAVFNEVFKLLVDKVSYSLYDDHLKIVNELFKLMVNFISDDCVIL